MEDSNCWDCSVCTFRNSPEAFKCLMCDVRKGTSTRKPRINPEMVAKQVARQQEQIKQQALKSVVKPRSIGSEKSAFHRTDDNSNSSISSSYDSSGRISPVQNGSNCSNGSASSLSTAISTSSFFDMNSSNNTFNTASSSSKTTLNLPSSSRVSSKIDSEEEVDENELERKKPVMSNQNCNKSANRKIGKTILGPKAKLKNVDRSDALYKEVTVNNFTVLITEFKPKRKLSEFSENHQNKSTTDLGSNSNKKIKDPSGGAGGDLGSPSSKSNPKSNNEQKKSPNKSINNSKSKEDQPTKKRNLQSGSDSLSSDHHGQPHLNNNNSVSKKMLPGVEQATK